MTFPINPNRDPKFRHTLTESDISYSSLCKKCVHLDTCGGWNVYSDARWCTGPGADCWEKCRAVCSKSPEKINYHAQTLGEGNFEWDEEGENAVPDLNIVGKHAWEPWELDFPPVGHQLNANVREHYEELYAVNIKFLYYDDRRTWSRHKNLKARFGIPKESKLAITFTSKDEPLDQLLDSLPDMAEEIAQYEGVDFVFAPNFSVYTNYPRIDNLFNIKRKMVALEEFQKQGLKVIPSVAYVTSNDFKNLATWMKDNKCPYMYMNFQVVSTTTNTAEWNALIHGMEQFRKYIGHEIRVFLFGCTGKDRIESILNMYNGPVTFMDSKAYRLAEYHKDYEGVIHSDLSNIELFKRNALAIRAEIDKHRP